jgi:ATP-dependent helicase/nuclease subunit A
MVFQNYALYPHMSVAENIGYALKVSGVSKAERQQRIASDPLLSAWVGASAGSGKTKVLTDRVLALLLAGTPPHKILCLTFTKAAAAEMRNRINGKLASWVTKDDEALAHELAPLVEGRLDGVTLVQGRPILERARRLFAEVLDVPVALLATRVQVGVTWCDTATLGCTPVSVVPSPSSPCSW